MSEFFVEHRLQSDGGKLLATYPSGESWSPKFGDLQLVAQMALRTYWAPQRGQTCQKSQAKLACSKYDRERNNALVM